MKTITLTCNSCDATFQKAKNEYTRRLKLDPENARFYCSLSCAGKQNAYHLQGRNPFVAGTEHHNKALAAASMKNTKYFGITKCLSRMLRSCRQRKKECTLTIEYLTDLWETQNGRCRLSNIPLDLYSSSYINMPSIDRIDSTLGYIESNIQFVSCAINLAKSNMSNDDALKLLDLICEHYPPNSDVSTETETGG